MSTTDKTLLGLCLLSLTIGLTQRSCSKNRMENLSEQDVGASASTAFASSPDGENESPPSPISYVVEMQPREDAHLSLNEKRLEAIRERDKRLDSGAPTPLADDFNYFDAREGLKDMLSKGSLTGDTNTLSEAEKWEYIESGDLPW